jgi:hypothetical protein
LLRHLELRETSHESPAIVLVDGEGGHVANQKRLGVIPDDAKLTPWPDDLLKTWDKLTDVENKLFIRQANVYAAYLTYP